MNAETTKTFVVVSDLHANARALRRALDLARSGPMDQLVILGDLLTYGLDVTEVLDLVGEALVKDRARLLLGNHDELYLELARGHAAYYASLPDWIRESVDLTVAALDVPRFRALPWEAELVEHDLLFAHANPFGEKDWRYLNSAADHAAAGRALASRSLRGGVFGHTHRAKIFVTDERDRASELPVSATQPTRGAMRVLVNPGSVGQPRETPPRASIARIHWGATPVVDIVPVDYDVEAHVHDLNASRLSSATKQRLASFFFAPRKAGGA